MQYGKRCTRAGDGVGAVQRFVDVQCGGQAGRTFGQFSVIAGRESTFATEVRAHPDLTRPEQNTARHKGGNLTQQVELSQALCDRNGWTVVEVITEKDSSASKFRVVEGRKVSARGEGWRRVVELVRTGTADVVVARHYDRLYRTTRDLVELVDLAEETGVHLAAAQAQGVLDLATPSGRLAARIGAAVAENETEMRVERQVLGHQRRRESGRPFWSTRPFGFERDGTHGDEEAEALQQAYRDVLAGVSLWSIAKDWNARELLSPHGNEWRSSNLRGVLLKPRNAGIQTYSQWVEKPDGRRVRVTEGTGTANWEPLVSEGMFRALARYLSDPERNTGGGGSARLCCPAWSAARSVRPS